MKVLYIVSLFPCWSETFIVREIQALKKRGVNIAIYSLKPPSEKLVQSDAESLCDQVIYPKSPVKESLSGFINFLKRPIVNFSILFNIIFSLIGKPESLVKSIVTFWRTLANINDIKQMDIDHIHAHWATYPSTSAMTLSKNCNIPYSFTSHAHDIFLENQILGSKIQACSFAVTISKFNIQYLKNLVGDWVEPYLNVVHCGIDTEQFAFQREDREDNAILAVGRFDEIKGFTYLLDACHELVKNEVNFECTIIGDGPLRQEFEKKINHYNLTQHVKLAGIMPQEEVRKHLYHCELFVLPSITTSEGNMDGIPVALMEAMAVGTPVISTKVSGIPELVIHEKTGLVAEEKNGEDLAKNIERLIGNKALQEKLTIAARNLVEEEFNIFKEAEKIHKLFENPPTFKKK